MNKKILLPLAVALLAAGCNSSKPVTTANPTPEPQPMAAPASNKLADQSYAKFTYLISGDTLTADAKKALTGFDMTKKALPDGTTQFTLKALKTEYKDQVYTLKTGEQLYFIEKFLQDDKDETNEDKTIKDDTAVVVDPQGNVIEQPRDFTAQ